MRSTGVVSSILPRLHQIVDQLDAEHDLELVVVAVVLRIVLGEGDVVVRVGRDDPLGADRAPVGDVVVGVLAREVHVAHLRRRPAAAPLLAHQAELDAAASAAVGRRRGCRRCGTNAASQSTKRIVSPPTGCRARRPSRRRAPAARASRPAPARCGPPRAARSRSASSRARCRSRPSARASPSRRRPSACGGGRSRRSSACSGSAARTRRTACSAMKSSAMSSTPTRPCSIATMLAWNAVGVWFSLRVTCMTGQTSRQNLCPEEKQP